MTATKQDHLNFRVMTVIELVREITLQLQQGDYKNYTAWLSIVDSEMKNAGILVHHEHSEIQSILKNATKASLDIISKFKNNDNQIQVHDYTAALVFIGVLHEHGYHLEKNVAEAINLFERAIRLGDATAMFNRACMHQNGEGGLDYPAAIALYERAIQLGNAAAMRNRARMHQKGQGGPVDYPAAIALYERAIQLENATAMFNRAYMHQKGEGGPVDYPAAIALYERAIQLGDAYAMHNRAYMHQWGEGGPVDYPTAIALYERAIQLGDAAAMRSRSCITNETSEEAQTLLLLLWDDLLANRFTPTAQTIALLNKECRDIVLQRILTLDFDVLESCCDANHPIAQILGSKPLFLLAYGVMLDFTSNYQKLCDHVRKTRIERQTLIALWHNKNSRVSTLMPEMVNRILSMREGHEFKDRKIDRTEHTKFEDIERPSCARILQWFMQHAHHLCQGAIILATVLLVTAATGTLMLGIAAGGVMAAGCLLFAYKDKIAASVASDPERQPLLG